MAAGRALGLSEPLLDPPEVGWGGLNPGILPSPRHGICSQWSGSAVTHSAVVSGARLQDPDRGGRLTQAVSEVSLQLCTGRWTLFAPQPLGALCPLPAQARVGSVPPGPCPLVPFARSSCSACSSNPGNAWWVYQRGGVGGLPGGGGGRTSQKHPSAAIWRLAEPSPARRGPCLTQGPGPCRPPSSVCHAETLSCALPEPALSTTEAGCEGAQPGVVGLADESTRHPVSPELQINNRYILVPVSRATFRTLCHTGSASIHAWG